MSRFAPLKEAIVLTECNRARIAEKREPPRLDHDTLECQAKTAAGNAQKRKGPRERTVVEDGKDLPSEQTDHARRTERLRPRYVILEHARRY